MLMVIFGAGASYDSWPSFPPDRMPREHEVFRPPLAKELFLHFDPFRQASQKYDRCQPLIPYLERQDNVEEILEQFRVEAEGNKERRRQLLALQFYIREVIRTCQNVWLTKTFGVTNFRTLVDQVHPCSEICFVTFNYDTLLEGALIKVDVDFPDIHSYVSKTTYKVFKLHGSIDWWSWRSAQNTNVRSSDQPSEADLIRAAPELEGEEVIAKEGARPPEIPREYLYHYYPALAIPTLSKSKFVCPPDHIEALEKCIKTVDKIVIVGWRAGERNFLEMLASGLPQGVDVIAACGNEQAARETLRNLTDAGTRPERSIVAPGGFTEFVLNRRIEPFLASQ